MDTAGNPHPVDWEPSDEDYDGSEEKNYCGNCEGQGEYFLFNNLSSQAHRDGLTDLLGNMSMAQVELVIAKYLTEIPPAWRDDILNDAAKQAEPIIKYYGQFGSIKGTPTDPEDELDDIPF